MHNRCSHDHAQDAGAASSSSLPEIVSDAFRWLTAAEALRQPDIFLPDSPQNVAKLMAACEHAAAKGALSPLKTLKALSPACARTVAGLVIQWLVLLPQPLVPPEAQLRLLHAQDPGMDQQQQSLLICSTLDQQMDRSAFSTLRMLLLFLQQYVLRQKEYATQLVQLAAHFAPVLLPSLYAQGRAADAHRLVCFLVSHALHIFRPQVGGASSPSGAAAHGAAAPPAIPSPTRSPVGGVPAAATAMPAPRTASPPGGATTPTQQGAADAPRQSAPSSSGGGSSEEQAAHAALGMCVQALRFTPHGGESSTTGLAVATACRARIATSVTATAPVTPTLESQDSPRRNVAFHALSRSLIAQCVTSTLFSWSEEDGQCAATALLNALGGVVCIVSAGGEPSSSVKKPPTVPLASSVRSSPPRAGDDGAPDSPTTSGGGGGVSQAASGASPGKTAARSPLAPELVYMGQVGCWIISLCRSGRLLATSQRQPIPVQRLTLQQATMEKEVLKGQLLDLRGAYEKNVGHRWTAQEREALHAVYARYRKLKAVLRGGGGAANRPAPPAAVAV